MTIRQSKPFTGSVRVSLPTAAGRGAGFDPLGRLGARGPGFPIAPVGPATHAPWGAFRPGAYLPPIHHMPPPYVTPYTPPGWPGLPPTLPTFASPGPPVPVALPPDYGQPSAPAAPAPAGSVEYGEAESVLLQIETARQAALAQVEAAYEQCLQAVDAEHQEWGDYGGPAWQHAIEQCTTERDQAAADVNAEFDRDRNDYLASLGVVTVSGGPACAWTGGPRQINRAAAEARQEAHIAGGAYVGCGVAGIPVNEWESAESRFLRTHPGQWV